jgi:tyrosine-protein kinase Etk/Wzc
MMLTSSPSSMQLDTGSRARSSAIEDGPTPTLMDIAAAVVERRRTIGLLGIAFALVAALVLALLRPTYTAVASVMPQSGSSTSKLSSLAAQFGISAQNASSAGSPEFYAYLLKSDAVLRQVILSPATADTTIKEGGPDIMAGLAGTRGTEADREWRALRKLRNNLLITPDDASGMVHIQFSDPSRALVQPVLLRMLQVLDNIVIGLRLSQSAAEGQFVQQRLAEAAQQLHLAEDQMERFLASNRDYEMNPQLQFQHDRLERELMIQQGVYLTLAQGYQQAKIDAVHDTPLLSVAEPPLPPIRADPKPYIVALLAGLFAGLAAGVVYSLAREYRVVAARSHADSYERLTRALQNTRHDVTNIARRLTRRGAKSA